jgi:hypothetical protein
MEAGVTDLGSAVCYGRWPCCRDRASGNKDDDDYGKWPYWRDTIAKSCSHAGLHSCVAEQHLDELLDGQQQHKQVNSMKCLKA